MSMLVSAGIGQCMKFNLIHDDQIPGEINANKDFFVGRNVHVELTIPNGMTLQVRDVVVMGKLTIQSSNLEDLATKGSFVTRDFFTPGSTSMSNINCKHRNSYIPEGIPQFKNELHDLIIEWLVFQRESVEKIGLKSVLE